MLLIKTRMVGYICFDLAFWLMAAQNKKIGSGNSSGGGVKTCFEHETSRTSECARSSSLVSE